jgi:hypothetical protein
VLCLREQLKEFVYRYWVGAKPRGQLGRTGTHGAEQIERDAGLVKNFPSHLTVADEKTALPRDRYLTIVTSRTRRSIGMEFDSTSRDSVEGVLNALVMDEVNSR